MVKSNAEWQKIPAPTMLGDKQVKDSNSQATLNNSRADYETVNKDKDS